MTSLLQAALISSPCWRCKHSISTTARTTSMSITAMSPVQNQRRGGWVLTVTGKAVGFGRSSSSTIRCMANPRRVKMVAKQIMRELSDMLLTDTVLQYAILPEASLGADLYLSSLATITDVQVSPDLQVVKVYVSVFGDERGKEVAIAGLKSKTKYVRSELGRRMKLRLTPEIRFIEDEAFERGSRVIAILDKIKNEKSPGSQNMEQLDASEHDDDDRDGEDPDEDSCGDVRNGKRTKARVFVPEYGPGGGAWVFVPEYGPGGGAITMPMPMPMPMMEEEGTKLNFQ